MKKLETVDLKGKDYATVPTRLKEFRSVNPRSSVTTIPHWNEDGSLDFEANVAIDQSDEFSMKGNGWAHYSASEMKNSKAYEKLSTIATGRALANIGYLNNGEIATTEEMLEFEGFKVERFGKAISEAQTIEDLMRIFGDMNSVEKKVFTEQLSARKKELANAR